MTAEFQYFMLHGRARWLLNRSIEEQQAQLIRTRKGGRWAILTPEALDHEACIYKMLEFRKQHVQRHITGLICGVATYVEGAGFVWNSSEEVARMNDAWLARYRQMAHDAKRALGKSLPQLADEQAAADWESEYLAMRY